MTRTRKKIIYAAIIMAVSGAYLLMSHYFIYYRIGAVGLKAPARLGPYFIGADKTMAENLIYAALGDSLTAGVGAPRYEESYPYLLAQALASEKAYQINLKNFSYPGAKTSDLINDLLSPAAAAQPDLITLLIGTNDVHSKIGAAAFKKNYQYILERLTKETSAKIHLVNLPYLGSPKLIFAPYNYYFRWRTWRFNKIIKELAEKYKVNYIDLASPAAIEFKKDQSLYSADKFHPSPAGYKLWARIIYDDINQ